MSGFEIGIARAIQLLAHASVRDCSRTGKVLQHIIVQDAPKMALFYNELSMPLKGASFDFVPQVYWLILVALCELGGCRSPRRFCRR